MPLYDRIIIGSYIFIGIVKYTTAAEVFVCLEHVYKTKLNIENTTCRVKYSRIELERS